MRGNVEHPESTDCPQAKRPTREPPALAFSVAGARRTASGMAQLVPTWGMFEVLTPEQKQPARVPRQISRGKPHVGSEKIGWPAIALLHEALHLPGVRSLDGDGEVFVVG